MKILIVDDNSTNRIVLKAIVEDFIEKSDEFNEVIILQAKDGIEALELFAHERPALVFMDIMMPNKDGIEATREIKALESKCMIVAVSALNDDENKSRILQAGAEDYLVKPLNGSVVKKRLQHYLTIINQRKSKSAFNPEPVNLFSDRIYKRRTIFLIDDEGALSEFWDCYLASGENYGEQMYDLIRVIYGISIWHIKLKHNLRITAEESESTLYFTLDGVKLLKKELLEKIIEKNCQGCSYVSEGNLISFEFKKFTRPAEQSAPEQSQIAENAPATEIAPAATAELFVYEFMDREDVEELEQIAADMNSMMLLVGSSELEEEEVHLIAGYIDSFARILSRYPETYTLYSELAKLAGDITAQSREFIERSKDIALLCTSFNNDLSIWLKKLFYEGAPSIDFMDKSIISNANMISNFITDAQDEEDEGAVEDIFDF